MLAVEGLHKRLLSIHTHRLLGHHYSITSGVPRSSLAFMEQPDNDKWAEWVLDRGHGGLSEDERADLDYLRPIRDRVLDNAGLEEGETLLDVGSGQGLIAFAALDRVGQRGKVIFSDISQPLLDHCRSVAEREGVLDRTEFVWASADDLSPVEDESADAVTTRSVLIYVDRKDAAFSEFHRVLRSGGRLSIFEPINRYFEMRDDDFWGFDASPVRDLVAKMNSYEGWDADSPTEDDPMMNFGERDLLELTTGAGFDEVRVELVLERKPGSWIKDWDTMLKTAPNPNAHTAGEIIEGALSLAEAARFESHIKPLVDGGQGVMESAFAYLRAAKH
jgi:ubiquinone/menaquinone biosynthesis C-methylase UbiE